MTTIRKTRYIDEESRRELAGKCLLVRVDFNVLDDETGALKSDTRLRRAVPTIRHALEEGASTVLLTHVGRPKGERVAQLSTEAIAFRLAELMGTGIQWCRDSIGPAAEEAVRHLRAGKALLLENVRFHAGETKGAEDLAEQWASLADGYVFDAFGAGERAEHASLGPTIRAMHKQGKPVWKGLCVKQEEEALGRVLQPRRPLMAVFGGGAKSVSEKIHTVAALLEGMTIDDTICLAGQLGNSLQMPENREKLELLLAKTHERGAALILPGDPTAHEGFELDAETLYRLLVAVDCARTVVWNGPLGRCEVPSYRAATERLAKRISERTRQRSLVSVIGGGDTEAAMRSFGLTDDDFSFLSTGGGAFLKYLELHGRLPVYDYLEG